MTDMKSFRIRNSDDASSQPISCRARKKVLQLEVIDGFGSYRCCVNECIVLSDLSIVWTMIVTTLRLELKTDVVLHFHCGALSAQAVILQPSETTVSANGSVDASFGCFLQDMKWQFLPTGSQTFMQTVCSCQTNLPSCPTIFSSHFPLEFPVLLFFFFIRMSCVKSFFAHL